MMKRDMNGFQMNYEDVGDGPAILLVHGFPLDHTLWTEQIKELSTDYRLIAPDLRGHGGSEVTSGTYHMDQLADDLRRLLEKLNVQQVALAGLSMGGYIVFAFWRRYSNLVKALILADTRAGADTPEGRDGRYTMIQRVEAGGTQAIVDDMLPKMLSPTTLKNAPEVVAHARRMMANTPAGGVIGALKGMAQRPDSSPTLATISVPTLVVVGEDDAITPPSEAEAMESQIRSAGPAPEVILARIPNAGHLAPMENPSVFNQTLQQFLAQVRD
jgi:3-oxoadipate enol-lactonase